MNEYDRVTDVLKFCSGMDKIPDFILSNAADRGKAVHESCESIIKGLGEMPIKEEWQGYVESFKKWYDPSLKFIMPERMFCDELKITGLVDLVLINNDTAHYFLYDLKTSAQQNLTWQLQLSAYCYLLKECTQIEIDRMYVASLQKNGDKAIIYNYIYDMQAFKECLNIYRRFFKGKKPELDIELI